MVEKTARHGTTAYEIRMRKYAESIIEGGKTYMYTNS
jgi:hypothetical protein